MKPNALLLLFLLKIHSILASEPPVTVVSCGSNSGLITVLAEVDDIKGFFILDTGSPGLILNQNFIVGNPSKEFFHDIHGGNLPMQTKLACLRIGGFCKRTQAIITDFTSIEKTTRLPILGVIGNSVFEDCEIVFDYIFKELTIYRLDKNGNPLQPRYLHEPPLEAIPFVLKGNLPVIKVRIGGIMMNMAIDSGAGVNLMELAKAQDIETWLKILDKKNLVGFGDESRLTPCVLVGELNIGDIQCLPMTTFMISLKKLNKFLPGPVIDGVLGFEFLSKYRVAINFKKKEFKIWETEYVKEQFALAKSEKD